MIWLRALALVGMAASACYWLAGLGCVAAFFRKRPRLVSKAPFRPPVSVLKPMHGVDRALEESLRAMADQDYPEFEILFGVESEEDPCVPLLRRVMAALPGKRISLVICGRRPGANPKVNNLAVLADRAANPILVLSDSDVRVGRDYLASIVAPLVDDKVGLVCCPYRWKDPQTLPSAIEALSFCAEFIPSVILVERFEGLKFALGATVVIRKSTLAKFGGFEAIQNHLADDYMIGKLAHDQGDRLVLSDYVVDLIHDEPRWPAMWHHQIRLVRTYRVCRPIGFFASALTHGTTWALLWIGLNAGSPWGWALGVGALALRFFCALILVKCYFPDRGTIRFLWLLPFRDLLASVWWLLAYLGNRVVWRGRSFKLESNGVLQPIS